MRHRVKGRKLKRTYSHKKALLKSLAVALFKHKRITTTIAKAKEARIFAEKIITKAKKALQTEDKDKIIAYKRQVSRFIKDIEAYKQLFNEIAPKAINRPGGYTRIVRVGRRLGDGAEMAIFELVDFNDVILDKEAKKKEEREKRKEKEKEKSEAAQAEAN